MQYALRITPPPGLFMPADAAEDIGWDAALSGLAMVTEDDGDDDAVTAVTLLGCDDVEQLRHAAERYTPPGGAAVAFAMLPVRLDLDPEKLAALPPAATAWRDAETAWTKAGRPSGAVSDLVQTRAAARQRLLSAAFYFAHQLPQEA